MDRQQADKLATWFDSYVAGFYGDDEYANANFRMKDEHSRRVCEEMLYLADELALPADQRPLARITGLFHDIGRFEQFREHRTYSDVRSVNHCLLGIEVLGRTKALAEVDPAERLLIEKAIECHGLKELPKDLRGPCRLFAEMIRDADKLDVLHLVVENYKQYTADPDKFLLEIEFPDEPRCSPEVVDAILNERLIDYSLLQTLSDMMLMQLGWVYNVNFTATLKRIRRQGCLESMIGFLPQTPQVAKAAEKILEYVDARLRTQ